MVDHIIKHCQVQEEYQVMDIGEGVAGQVAELRVVHQVLQQRLSEKVSGTSPQSLTFVGSMSAPCRPVRQIQVLFFPH